MDGRTPGLLTRGKLCCHCLAIETSDGLVRAMGTPVLPRRVATAA